MRIHTSNDVTAAVLRDAARAAGAWFDTLTEHRSTTHAHAFEVKLRGSSGRWPNGGNRGADTFDHAATWDQWGAVIAAVLAVDPSARCAGAYANRADFDAKTGNRFTAPGMPADAHGDHVFRYNGTPYRSECTRCSAVQIWEPYTA